MPDETNPPQRIKPRKPLYLDSSGGASSADAAGADINKIVAQYRRHGTLPGVLNRNPLYGDYTFPEDIHSMREAVHQAEDRFHDLPAAVRTLCDNDWVQFMDRFEDPEARAELVEAGLIIEPPLANTSNPDTTILSNNRESAEVEQTPTDEPGSTPSA